MTIKIPVQQPVRLIIAGMMKLSIGAYKYIDSNSGTAKIFVALLTTAYTNGKKVRVFTKDAPAGTAWVNVSGDPSGLSLWSKEIDHIQIED